MLCYLCAAQTELQKKEIYSRHGVRGGRETCILKPFVDESGLAREQNLHATGKYSNSETQLKHS